MSAPPDLLFYRIRYQATPALLRGEVLRPLSALEITEVCELLLAAAREHGCPYWLLDGRADVHARPADVYDWMSEEFLPRVHRVLGRIPSIAFLARPELEHELQIRGYTPPTVMSTSFRTAWFTTEAAALAWLATFRTGLPAPQVPGG